MGKVRKELTPDQKNVVLQLISEDFCMLQFHEDAVSYVGKRLSYQKLTPVYMACTLLKKCYLYC